MAFAESDYTSWKWHLSMQSLLFFNPFKDSRFRMKLKNNEGLNSICDSLNGKMQLFVCKEITGQNIDFWDKSFDTAVCMHKIFHMAHTSPP